MEELLPALAAGEIDAILGRLYAPAVPDGFLREPLWEEPISILARAGHPILAAPSAEALRRCELVLPTVTQRVGQEIEHLLDLLGLPRDVHLRSSSYGFIREMLLASDAVSIMPRSMMVGDLLRGALEVVPLPVPAPPRRAGNIQPADPPPSWYRYSAPIPCPVLVNQSWTKVASWLRPIAQKNALLIAWPRRRLAP